MKPSSYWDILADFSDSSEPGVRLTLHGQAISGIARNRGYGSPTLPIGLAWFSPTGSGDMIINIQSIDTIERLSY